MAMESATLLNLTLLLLLSATCRHRTSATTRYIPSSSSSSPWQSVSSSLYQPSPLFVHRQRSNNHNLLPSASSPEKTPQSSSSSKSSSPSPPLSTTTTTTTITTIKMTSELASRALHRDLSKLSRLLPGVYTNMQQYRQAAGRKEVPRHQRHVLLRSSFRPVTLSFLSPRDFSVLVQDFSGDSLFPFRQRVYSFTVDLAHRALRMKVWNFATKRLEKRSTQNLRTFPKLRRKDLVSQDSCDMFWRRLDRTTFMGITGKQCLGYVKGEEVRITVSMTLTSQLLQTNEGWYRARDGKTLVEVDIPYNLLRTKAFPMETRKKHKGQKLLARWRQAVDLNPAQNDLPPDSSSLTIRGASKRNDNALEVLPHISRPKADSSKKPRDSKRNPNKRPSSSEVNAPSSDNNKKSKKKPHHHHHHHDRKNKNSADKDSKAQKRKEWVLSSYEEIAKALHSGHLVFYSVELSACTLPAQMKAERLSFGDFVDSFQSAHRHSHREGATVRFWQSKFVQGDEGMEKIIREITIHSNGRVLVRLLRKSTDTGKVAWDHTAQCKLFEPHTGLGGVKMTSRPAADVHEITTFGRFRSALRRGRRQVRMIIDLKNCEGRMRGDSSIMGTTVRAYDFINQGKAVEVSQLTPDADHVHLSLLTGQFLNNGEVIFITSLQPQSLSGKKTSHQQRGARLPLFYRDSTYRCALSGSEVTNNGGPWGVRLFYTT